MTNTMKIKFTINDKIVTATLIDSVTTHDFIALLPLNITLKEYAGTEAVADLPKKLSTNGMPSGYKPSKGDITYYAPWGNLAIFHKDFNYSHGLVLIAKLDADIDLFNLSQPIKVTIELMP
ncbi:cyclophilin-like fold protein [Zophobihabitans entericus]|nr:cyclophilin-like fold protein [Zophobihabitans entericus]